MVLPHFDPVGKSNDTEMILGSEVVENSEEGILGLGKHKTKTVTSDQISPHVPWLGNCTPGTISGVT